MAISLMGILNVTPDSFSDGGRYHDPAAAVARAHEMERDGANILDIGGESTRPGSVRVPEGEELARIRPVLEALQSKLGIPVSIDTLHPSVAQQAVRLGARFINHIVLDLETAREMALLARDSGMQLILAHARGPLETMHKLPRMSDPVREVVEALEGFRTLAVRAGLPLDRLLLDPGIGFGKDADESYALLRGIDKVQALGCRVVLGTSRKRFLSKDPARDRAEDRDFATAATVVYALERGCAVVRVHNVRAMSQVMQVARRLYPLASVLNLPERPGDGGAVELE
jgi:dihydropteroate synthase